MWCHGLVLVVTTLCLSAFPTTPIMHQPPSLSMDASDSRVGRRGDESETVWAWLLNRGSRGLKEGWGSVRGRSRSSKSFFTFQKVDVRVIISRGRSNVTLSPGGVVKMSSKPFNVIPIESLKIIEGVLTTHVLFLQGNSDNLTPFCYWCPIKLVFLLLWPCTPTRWLTFVTALMDLRVELPLNKQNFNWLLR